MCKQPPPSQEIKAHPFFAGVQWDSLHATRPPYTPRVEHELDTQVGQGAGKVVSWVGRVGWVQVCRL